MNLNTNFDACLSFPSPVGDISLFSRSEKIVALHMGAPAAPNIGSSDVLEQAKAQLQQYFEGKIQDFNLPLDPHGTDFQKAVWNEISKVGFGEIITYQQIAAKIGKPLASRAVGGAVGSNPIALLIGCHRVLGASGRITGYSGGDGIPTKRWLLAHEQIATVD
ncbi:MAG: methylated-DNA--[protein]-cysteine S-methyltransferase [Micrococcales bacterium]